MQQSQFTAFFPEAKTSSWTTQLTRSASNPCGSSYFGYGTSVSIIDFSDPEKHTEAIKWLVAPDLATAKNGVYDIILRDDAGKSYTYSVNISGGQPNPCPSASPTVSPTPQSTPTPNITPGPSSTPTPTPTSTPGPVPTSTITPTPFPTGSPFPSSPPFPGPDPSDTPQAQCEKDYLLPHQLDESIQEALNLSTNLYADISLLNNSGQFHADAEKALSTLEKMNYPIFELLDNPAATSSSAFSTSTTIKQNQRPQIQNLVNEFINKRNQLKQLLPETALQRDTLNARIESVETKIQHVLGVNFPLSMLGKTPNSLVEYEHVFQTLDEDFSGFVSSGNTYNLADAITIYSDEVSLYNMLVQDYLSGKFIYENTTNLQPKDVISKLEKQIRLHSDRLVQAQAQISGNYQQKMKVLRDALIESREVLTKTLVFPMLDSGVLDPDTLKINPRLLRGDFSTLAENPIDNCLNTLFANAYLNTNGLVLQSEMLNCFDTQIHEGVVNARDQVGTYKQIVDEAAADFLYASQGSLDDLNQQINQLYENKAALFMVTAYLIGPREFLEMDSQQKSEAISSVRDALKFTQSFLVPQDNLDLALMIVTGPGNKGQGVRASLSKFDEFLEIIKKYGKYSDTEVEQLNRLHSKVKDILKLTDEELAKICGNTKTTCNEFLSEFLFRYPSFNKPFRQYLGRNLDLLAVGSKVDRVIGTPLPGKIKYFVERGAFKDAKALTFQAAAKTPGEIEVKKMAAEFIQKFECSGNFKKNCVPGVFVKPNGFYNLDEYQLYSLDVSQWNYKFIGNRQKVAQDFNFANEKVSKAFFDKGWIEEDSPAAVKRMMDKYGLVWHHHEDLKTFQLVPEAIHASHNHIGASSLLPAIRNNNVTHQDWQTYVGRTVPSYYWD